MAQTMQTQPMQAQPMPMQNQPAPQVMQTQPMHAQPTSMQPMPMQVLPPPMQPPQNATPPVQSQCDAIASKLAQMAGSSQSNQPVPHAYPRRIVQFYTPIEHVQDPHCGSGCQYSYTKLGLIFNHQDWNVPIPVARTGPTGSLTSMALKLPALNTMLMKPSTARSSDPALTSSMAGSSN